MTPAAEHAAWEQWQAAIRRRDEAGEAARKAVRAALEPDVTAARQTYLDTVRATRAAAG